MDPPCRAHTVVSGQIPALDGDRAVYLKGTSSHIRPSPYLLVSTRGLDYIHLIFEVPLDCHLTRLDRHDMNSGLAGSIGQLLELANP